MERIRNGRAIRRWMLTLIVLLFSSAVVSARQLLQDSVCIVPEDTVVDGTLLVLCDTLQIDGVVNGDVFGVGLRTVITGRVNGSIYLAGFSLRHDGSIDRALHYVGITLDINAAEDMRLPAIGGNAVVGVLRGDLEKNAQIIGSLFTAGYQWTLNGTIDGEVNFWGSRLEINGIMRKPVYATVGDPSADGSQIRSLLLPFGFDVVLQPPGMVLGRSGLLVGSLEYSGPVPGDLEGTTLGPVEFRSVSPSIPVLAEPDSVLGYGRDVLREFTALLVLGLLGWVLAPQLWTRPMIMLRMRPIHSVSFGLLAFILSFPVVFILVMITALTVMLLVVIGLDGIATAIGLLLLVVNTSAGGVFYFTAIYLSRVVSCWAIGRFALRSSRADMTVRTYTLASLAVGTLIVSLLAALPTIGWIINALTLFFGLGALLLVLTDNLQKARGLTPPTSTPFTPVSVYRPSVSDAPTSTKTDTTPPLLDAPGMSNLPPGFDPDRFFRG